MAVYNSLQPLTQVADLPEFMRPSWFRQRNGQSTQFGNIFNAAVPALTTIAGTLIGGPAGTAIGAAAGQAIVGGVNRLSSAEAGAQGAEDAQATIDNSLGRDMATANLTSSLAGMVGVQPGVTGTNGGPSVPASLRLNPIDGDTLPGLIGSAASVFGRRPGPVVPRGSSYQAFADGGVVEPIATRPLPMNAGGRERRRQQRLTDGLSERVESELTKNALAQETAASQRTVEAYQAGRIAPALVTRTEENRSGAVRANVEGANYTRSWMAGRGYSGYTGEVMTPELVRPTDFVQNTGLSTNDAAGVYVPDQDRSYTVDFYDKNRTRSVATHEATHDAQDALQHTPEMQQSLKLIEGRVKAGSDEYLGRPEEVQARLMQMREGIAQDPGKKFNRWKWRLGNVANALSFGLANRAQNEAFRDVKGVMGRKAVFDSLDDTFASGGRPQRGNYVRYADGDKQSEDMLMIDKTTGQKVGEMRYGERIYDQAATDKVDRAIRLLNLDPTPDGFARLGKYVFEETRTHKDRNQVETFQGGGKPTRPARVSGSTTVTDIGLVHQRLRQERARVEQQENARELAAVRGQYATATNPILKARLKARIESLTSKQPIPVAPPRPAPPRTSAAPIISTTPPTTPRPSLPTPAAGTINPNRQPTALPRRSAPALAPPVYAGPSVYTVQPGDTLSQIAKNTGNSTANLANWNSVADPDKIEIGQRLGLAATVMPTVVSPIAETPGTPTFARLQMQLPTERVQPLSLLKPEVAPPKPPGYNILSPGNIADAARVFLGYSQASRPLLENPVNPDYLKLLSQAGAEQNDGLGPATRKLYKDASDDSRSIAIEAIRRSAGGGGSAGAVIGGLGTINDATSTDALKLATADEQARLAKQQRYERLLGGQMGMEDQRFASAFNAGLRNQQAGVNLVQQGMEGLEGRFGTWNMYERPGSAGARFGALQVENEQDAKRSARSAYERAARILTNR